MTPENMLQRDWFTYDEKRVFLESECMMVINHLEKCKMLVEFTNFTSLKV